MTGAYLYIYIYSLMSLCVRTRVEISRSARESQNFIVQFFRVDLAFSSLSWGIFVDSDDSDVVTSD